MAVIKMLNMFYYLVLSTKHYSVQNNE